MVEPASNMMEQQRQFTFWRAMRLGSFHVGSAMGDILVTSIWNRILISNFGIPATPVGLLIALRYLLSPLSIWAGNLTDNKPLFGLRRTPVIWLGRGLMVFSLPFLGLSVWRLGSSSTDALGWLFAVLSSLMYGIGTLISGSSYLALVRESAPEERQGVAISVVETILIIFFAIAGIGAFMSSTAAVAKLVTKPASRPARITTGPATTPCGPSSRPAAGNDGSG